jgi:thymidylate synthase
MKEYLDKLEEIFTNGTVKTDRTGVGTKSIFGMQMRFDLREEFPVVTTKKIHLKSIVHELLWMISGDNRITRMREAGVSIWEEWAGFGGDVGRTYGQQWRHWSIPVHINVPSEFAVQSRSGTQLDQLQTIINAIKKYPDSRRLLVTAWNPAEIHRTPLPPCHVMFQFYVVNGELSCSVYQRK